MGLAAVPPPWDVPENGDQTSVPGIGVVSCSFSSERGVAHIKEEYMSIETRKKEEEKFRDGKLHPFAIVHWVVISRGLIPCAMGQSHLRAYK